MDIPYDKAPERIMLGTTTSMDLVAVKVEAGSTVPLAWLELIQAIALLSKHQTNEIRPFQCSHDQLSVQSDWTKYSEAEIRQLDEWGFHVDHEYGGFYSFKYGSA